MIKDVFEALDSVDKSSSPEGSLNRTLRGESAPAELLLPEGRLGLSPVGSLLLRRGKKAEPEDEASLGSGLTSRMGLSMKKALALSMRMDVSSTMIPWTLLSSGASILKSIGSLIVVVVFVQMAVFVASS